jgi:hypothetical protein
MNESCTVYCKVLDLGEMSRLIQSYALASTPSVGGTVCLHGSRGSLRLTQIIFRERGDEFCRLLNSTCVFIESISNVDVAVKNRLVNHIESCELLVGVVADSAFDADERYHAIVFEIAKALDGVVWNGQEMLDANGVTLVALA